MKIRDKEIVLDINEVTKDFIIGQIYHEINIPLAILRSQGDKLDEYGKEALDKIEEILFNLRNL